MVITRKDIYSNPNKNWNIKFKSLLNKAIKTEKKLEKLKHRIKKHEQKLAQ